MNITLKILYVLSWIPVAAIKITLALLGLFVIPIALSINRTSTQWPKLFWIWGNQENVPGWWQLSSMKHWYTEKFPNFWWYAVRNPVNNAQFIFDDPELYATETNWSMTEKMEAAEMVEANQRMASIWRWSGPFAGYRRVWIVGETFDDFGKYSEIWFGWKVGSTVPGMGFTMQVRLNRKIGT